MSEYPDSSDLKKIETWPSQSSAKDLPLRRTKMPKPSKELDEILNKLLFDFYLWSTGELYPDPQTNKTDIDYFNEETDHKQKTTKAINQLITQEKINTLAQLKADHIQEWVGIDSETMTLKTAPKPILDMIDDRIATLKSELEDK